MSDRAFGSLVEVALSPLQRAEARIEALERSLQDMSAVMAALVRERVEFRVVISPSEAELSPDNAALQKHLTQTGLFEIRARLERELFCERRELYEALAQQRAWLGRHPSLPYPPFPVERSA